MSASLIEIVQLANGDIEVRRVDDVEDDTKRAPLVNISFSDESREFLGDALMEVARAMVHAGLDCVSEIMDEAEQLASDDDFNDHEAYSQRILH